jgi:hypothetical protein
VGFILFEHPVYQLLRRPCNEQEEPFEQANASTTSAFAFHHPPNKARA